MSLSKFTFKNIATIVLVGMFFLAPLSFISAAPLADGMDASFVLGQADLVTGTAVAATASTFVIPLMYMLMAH